MTRFGALAMMAILTVTLILQAGTATAQAPLGNQQYAFKIYAVNSGFYPIVQVYLRTWDQQRDPLINVNYFNIGLMVRGQNYDPAKGDPESRHFQYEIKTLQNREEGFRTVLVLDCSLSMAGKPFADAQQALLKYVEAKRPADQIAVIAIRDTDQGYQIVSGFEKNPTLLYQRIQDVKCDGKDTRLYDSIAAAMEMCATASQGGTSNAGAEHAVLSTILVLSDGKDEGSAVARDEIMNRIGQLSIPIPIYSLAYSNIDKSAFLNLEALSKGSFGRYWMHEDSQEFASTVQKIHQINRSDYVLTFRSYVPVDGEKHPVKIGISWPSDSGRFVYDSAEFEAVDSPAAYLAETRSTYEQLQKAYPILPDGCPYMNCAQMTGLITPAGPADTDTSLETDATPSAVSSDAETEAAASSFDENGALLGLGAGILALIIAVLAWVKRGGTGAYAGAGPPDTHHRRQMGNGPGNAGSRSGSESDSSTKDKDTTSRL
ncbi:MAG: VWA domain-containing protein [Candidatus Hydrogenedentes bacterium]|nr:VWA domain-containing protein [Candidatus Hydrogenedentota bacterium]